MKQLHSSTLWMSCLCSRRPVPPAGIRFFSAGMDAPELVEEQTLPRYAQKHYYPMRLGQRLADRYSIISKLGFGAYSTVWLAKDERTNKYVSVKVCVQDDTAASPVLNEIKALQHMKACPQEHDGANHARQPDDLFQLDGPTGKHHCVVARPRGCSLWFFQQIFPNRQVPDEFVKHIVRCMLGCINWLYFDCKLIHTEITTQNVLTQAQNDDLFAALEQEEAASPSVPLVVDNGYPVYLSRGYPRSILDALPIAYLTDFGSARSGNIAHQDWWMPDTYRAPEVLMGVPWGCQVDVWSIGIMALELLEGRNLFDPIDTVHRQYVLPLAIAQYISVLGPPPLWMIQESQNPYIPTFFDAEGNWIGGVPIPEFSLEDWITALPPGEAKEKFVKFMRRILVWDGMERGTSSDLFEDEWTKREDE